MATEDEPGTGIRRVSASRALDTDVSPPREPLFGDERSGRTKYLFRALTALVVALVLAVIVYESFAPAEDEALAWTPPAGLTAAETPPWLQTLCSNRTPELCAAANRARNPSDCEALRAALRSVEAVERKLSARGTLGSNQHWVLIELYGQGHTLCQFVRGGPPAKAK